MAGQPKATVRRLSQVFVEIPSSALHKPNNNITPTTSNNTTHMSSRKENALRASVSQNTVMNKSSKRKADETHEQPSKKSKLETTAVKLNATRRPLANATPDFPNGFVYCHQCNKKRDALLTVQCTREDAKSNRRCITKYCGPCLKNRYGLALQDVLSTSTAPAGEKKRHVSGEGYFFKCPRCEETCNCVQCRKAKGLEPTGNLTVTARKSGLQSAADVLLQDPTAAGPMAGKPVAEKKSRTVKSAPQPATSATSQSKSEPTKKPAHISTPAAPKPLPKALWTPVRTHLSLHGAEARIYIREFALRFLPLSRAHHDELECLSRSRLGFDDDEDEDGDLEPWVSEGCVKSLLIALLGMIEIDAKILSTTANALHQQSFLFKIVNTLSILSILPSLALPSPTPAPEHLLESVPIIRTRSARTSSHSQTAKEKSKETEWPEVVRTSQLIPVISALVDHAIQTQAVRDALEEGVKEAKELTRESAEMKRALERAAKERREKEKAEKEQQDKDKKGQGKDKKAKGKGGVSAKEKEKDAEDLEDGPTHTLTPQTALTLALSSYSQRITPLGQDSEGRVYWALTPGRGERDASREYLASNGEVGERHQGTKTKNHKTKSKSPWTPPSLSERASHKRWSWFVAVWGVRPSLEERLDPPKDGDYAEDDSESESELDSEAGEDEDKSKKPRQTKTKAERPRWYAFSDPKEIFKLAVWIERKAGLESHYGKSKPRVISALPSRAASASTSRAVSASNAHTSASTSRATSSFNSSATKRSNASLLADVEMIASSEADSDASESESGDDDQSEDDDMDVDSPVDFDDTAPRTPQIRSLVRELRVYAELLKKRV
ncbi:hypothetical protein DFH29DRAFT_896967 [Suillus ampliporus]|nr:hypothetical protein DFH29DRAFT_896967 [Suillus ampliporus]